MLQFKTPCSLCSVTWGLDPVSCCPHTCTACQVGQEGSSARPGARAPCPEQVGRKSEEAEAASCTTDLPEAHTGRTDLVSSAGTRHRQVFVSREAVLGNHQAWRLEHGGWIAGGG